MDRLSEMKCVPCKGGEPTVTDREAQELQPQIPEWRILGKNGEKRLERTFSFKDFAQALAFTNHIGQLAEAQEHHPRIVTEWGQVTVDWWTHAIHGLHRNDFIMAAKTDEAYSKPT